MAYDCVTNESLYSVFVTILVSLWMRELNNCVVWSSYVMSELYLNIFQALYKYIDKYPSVMILIRNYFHKLIGR